jgi:hypothetical protein
MEYRHKESLQTKRFKTQASTGKVILTFFGIRDVLFLQTFSQRYIETLTALKRRIERIRTRNETLFQPTTPGLTPVQQQAMHFNAWNFQCCRIHRITHI